MPLVLGVDSSTQSTKVEVRDADTGELVALGRAPHPPTTPPRSEQDPEAWWDALHAAVAHAGVDGARRRRGRGRRPAARHGRARRRRRRRASRPSSGTTPSRRPTRGWLVDQLATAARPRGPTRAARCRSPRSRSRSCRGCTAREPDAWARVARVCLPHDWLTWKLAGEFVTDRGDASGTGYFSAARDEYRLDLLAIVDARRRLGDAAPARARAGRARRARRARSARARSSAPGTGDNMAAALALGLRPGRRRDLARHVGHRLHGERHADRRPDRRGRRASPTRPAASSRSCARSTRRRSPTRSPRWLGVDHAELDALALAAPPGANGVVVVPYFDGERTPEPARRDRARSPGCAPSTTREDLARAAVEGVVCGLLDGLDALTAAGVRADGDIVLVGGGARSAAYQRVLADLSGRRGRRARRRRARRGGRVRAGRRGAARARHRRGRARVGPRRAASTIEPDPTSTATAVRAAYADGPRLTARRAPCRADYRRVVPPDAVRADGLRRLDPRPRRQHAARAAAPAERGRGPAVHAAGQGRDRESRAAA